ncbi:hypothetical protein K523DRAFT_331516 [Schizophyllum commune Tattone D]|nr:hypothetical protein K523DRAFT_331516 [Schizophyllum commune Tattone D]
MTAFVDLCKGQKENGSKVQGWAVSWDDKSPNRAWNFDQKTFRGRQIQTIIDDNSKIKGKVIVQYPDRMLSSNLSETKAAWATSSRGRLFLFKGYVLSHANETIKVDRATVSCVEDATQEISSLTAVLTGDKALDKALFFESPQDDIPKGLTHFVSLSTRV